MSARNLSMKKLKNYLMFCCASSIKMHKEFEGLEWAKLMKFNGLSRTCSKGENLEINDNESLKNLFGNFFYFYRHFGFDFCGSVYFWINFLIQ
jgi:hypothetical protein